MPCSRSRCVITVVFLFCAVPALAQSGYPIAIGGAGTDRLETLSTDPSGNVTVGGVFKRTIDVDPGPGVVLLPGNSFENGWVASYTPQGSLRWAAEVAGGGFQNVSDVATDAEGGATAVGFFSGTVDFDPGPNARSLTATDSDLFVVSYDANGALRYAFVLDGPASVQEAYIASDVSGFVYVAGSLPRDTPTDFDPGAGEFVLTAQPGSFEIGFLAAYALDGSFLWAELIEGPGLMRPRGVAPRPGGGVAVTGEFAGTVDFAPSGGDATRTSGTSADAFVAVYDAGGALELAYGVGGNGFDTGIDVAVDAQSRTALVGRFQGAVDFNPGSEVLEYQATGGTLGDGFVAVYEPDGALVFAWDLNQALATDIAFGPEGSVTAAGQYEGTVDFDPSAESETLTSMGGSDVYAVVYEPGGALRYAASMGSQTGNEVARGVAVDGTGRATLAGQFFGTVDFDPGPGIASLTAQATDGFITLLTPQGVLPTASEAPPTASALGLRVFPNPARDQARVHLQLSSYGPARVVLVNMLGREVAMLFDGVMAPGHSVSLQMPPLAAGVYIVRAVTSEGHAAVPVIVIGH
ncbi:MAG: T9SS type A sorting domain-containing protein [Rhodothermales bacterium]